MPMVHNVVPVLLVIILTISHVYPVLQLIQTVLHVTMLLHVLNVVMTNISLEQMMKFVHHAKILLTTAILVMV